MRALLGARQKRSPGCTCSPPRQNDRRTRQFRKAFTHVFYNLQARAQTPIHLKPLLSIPSALFCAFAQFTFTRKPFSFYGLRTFSDNDRGWGYPPTTVNISPLERKVRLAGSPPLADHGSRFTRHVPLASPNAIMPVPMAKAATEVSRISPEVLAGYEPVIGLEVHVQLKTETKIFCGCSTRFGDPPNTNTCPVCLGLPGSLPVMNKKALEFAARAALALHLHVEESSRFARKNYFYPDLPKGYQISMYELPLAVRGWLEIEDEGQTKRIGITRLHLEEDAAKNLHEGFPDSAEKSYVDYNRCGMPLVEIVSEPDLRSPVEAHAYLTALKQILEYAGISDCDMEKGTLRCDANVSVRRRGAEKFGTKAEVKNLNSFRYLQRALEYEIERQIGVLESGGRVDQETRLWNVPAGRTEPMRSKEFAHDYRYFPDPDLLPVRVSAGQLAEIAAHMPELPDARRARYLAASASLPTTRES